MGRSPAELRAVFDASPTARIIGDEVFDWVEPLNMRDVRSKIVPWMEKSGYLSGDYSNADRGWNNIAITEKGVQNSLAHGSGPEKIQVFAALPEMIRDGIYVGTTSGKTYQQGMKRHIFAAKVDICGKSLLVGFVIMEDASGRRFYDHEMTKIKNLDGLTPQAGTIGLDTEKAHRTRQDSKTTNSNGRPSQGGADGSDTVAAFRTHQDSNPESIINIVQNRLRVNT
jgi:hypothetical protein